MSNNQNQLPTVLHEPNSKWIVHSVRDTHIPRLREVLWSQRTETRCRQLIKRINDAEERKRGLGIVINEDDSDGSPVLAYGQIMKWTRCAEISDLVVIPEKRSKGIGSFMCQYLTRYIYQDTDVDCVEIGAAKSNPRALELYRRLGFKDAYSLNLKLEDKREPVIYLRIFFKDYDDSKIFVS